MATSHVEDDTALSLSDTQELLLRQEQVLGMIAEGSELSATLTTIVTALQDLMVGARCSILLLNHATATLHHGAAPDLPAAYTAGINGMAIGDGAGSCGTAAFLDTAVVAEDIRTDPRWDEFRDLALPHGLRSCWSTPIRGRDGVTGTFAVYHDSPHSPSSREQHLVERFTRLSSVAIDHDQLFGALAESEQLLRHAFEDHAVGMALTDLEGRIIRVNGALREMLDHDDADLLGVPIDQLVEADSHVAVADNWLHELASGRQTRLEFPASGRRGTGGDVHLLVYAAAIRGASGQPVILGLNLLDVTDREAAEAERRARREAEVARRFAESASRNKSAFVAAMSHDLRTPLQSIAGFTEMLRTMDLPADRRDTALEHIARATQHITAMVDGVLDIALIEAGTLPLHAEHVPVGRVTDDVVALAQHLSQKRAVSVDVQPSDAIVLADERRLRQVLLNLVTNAITYNHPQGSVDVTVSEDDDHVSISLSNTGPGIPPDRLDRLFVPFDRLGAEESGEPGIGLGLTLSLGLTEAMGGSLTVASEPGERTTVVVTLLRGDPQLVG